MQNALANGFGTKLGQPQACFGVFCQSLFFLYTVTNDDYIHDYVDVYNGKNILAYQYPLPRDYYSWCSGETDVLPNVTITLTEPVVLYGLLSGGLESQYVTNFSMEYSESEDGPLLQHDPLGNLLVNTLYVVCVCVYAVILDVKCRAY